MELKQTLQQQGTRFDPWQFQGADRGITDIIFGNQIESPPNQRMGKLQRM